MDVSLLVFEATWHARLSVNGSPAAMSTVPLGSTFRIRLVGLQTKGAGSIYHRGGGNRRHALLLLPEKSKPSAVHAG
jgi:hypothetical protein